MGIRILHTADLHLGSEYRSFDEKARLLQQESLSAFEKMAGYAADPVNGISLMIVAGDLFDTHKPDLPLAERVMEVLRRVTENGVKLFILPGNHDSASYRNSVYRSEDFPGTVIRSGSFSPAGEMDFGDQHVTIYGGMFDVSASRKRLLQDFRILPGPGIHIGILHGTLEMREVDIPERELPFSWEEFSHSGLNYLALGHFHTFFEKQTDEKHKMAYPGTLLLRKITEYGDKCALVTEIGRDGTVRIEKLAFSRIRSEKRIIRPEREGIADMRTLALFLKKSRDPSLILDLFLEGAADFSVDENFLKERLKDDFFFMRLTNNLALLDSSLVGRMESEETIRGLFFKKLTGQKVSGTAEEAVLNQAVNLGLREFAASPEPERSFIKKVVPTQDIMEID